MNTDFQQRSEERQRDASRAVGYVKASIAGDVDCLHPTYRAKVLREIADHCTSEAEQQEATNEREGVPE